MHPTAPKILLALIAALTLAAAAVLAVGGDRAAGRRERAAEFQRLMGGLGLGPAVDMSECGFSFDPRVRGACDENHGPLPGGIYFCRHHACSILFVPQPQADAEIPREVPRDADTR